MSEKLHYCNDLTCFNFAPSHSFFCATHSPAVSQSSLLSGISSFSRNTLKPTTTVVRTLGDLHKAQEELEALGWRTFQGFVIPGTKPEPKADVAFSARFVAAVRAIEHERDDALFRDPFALALAGRDAVERVNAMMKQEREEFANATEENRPYWCPARPYLLIRTRFIDDQIAEALRRSPFTPSLERHWQVVILGAGMDSRPFRLTWPQFTHAFEIDRPEVMQFKQDIAGSFPPSPVVSHYLSADLSEEGACSKALLSVGFLVDCPTLWIIEGLLYYLPTANVDILMTQVAQLSSPGYVIADVVNEAEREAVSFRSSVADPEQFFARFGFEASTVLQPGDQPASFGRFTRPFPARAGPGEADPVRRSFLVAAWKA